MVQIWANALANALTNNTIVDTVSIQANTIAVRYKTSVIEYFWVLPVKPPAGFIAIDRNSSRITKPISVHNLFEDDLIDGVPVYQCIIISKRSFAAGTTIDQSLAIQKFIAKTCEVGWQMRLPISILDVDLKKFREYNYLYNLNNGRIDWAIHTNTERNLGNRILLHFFDLNLIEYRKLCTGGRCLLSLGSVHKHPRAIYRLARKLENEQHTISSYNVGKLALREYGPRRMFGGAYAALFDLLKINSVFDPYPETGSKAMACTLLDIDYITKSNKLFDVALERGFAGYVGLKHYYFNKYGIADCVLVDFNFLRFDYREALKFADCGKKLIVYVPAAHKYNAIKECVPSKIIDCVFANRLKGYFFIF